MGEDITSVMDTFCPKENPSDADQGKGDCYLHVFVKHGMPVECYEAADVLPEFLRPDGTIR